MRLLTASGDLVGASASASLPPLPTEPGTRLALGTRFGRPACVVSPAAGTARASAARQPSSAGEIQDGCTAVCSACATCSSGPAREGRAVLRGLPLLRNQSDSS